MAWVLFLLLCFSLSRRRDWLVQLIDWNWGFASPMIKVNTKKRQLKSGALPLIYRCQLNSKQPRASCSQAQHTPLCSEICRLWSPDSAGAVCASEGPPRRGPRNQSTVHSGGGAWWMYSNVIHMKISALKVWMHDGSGGVVCVQINNK